MNNGLIILVGFLKLLFLFTLFFTLWLVSTKKTQQVFDAVSVNVLIEYTSRENLLNVYFIYYVNEVVFVVERAYAM